MTMALNAKTKFGLIDGIIVKPNPPDPKYAACRRCSTMILSWIFNSISKEIAASIIFTDSVEEMWKDLQDLFFQ